jgi:hypothetical protein
MKKITIPPQKDFIRTLYAEKRHDLEPDPLVGFTARTTQDNLLAIDAFAKFFGVTRSRIITDIIEDAMIPVLMSLEIEDRKTVIEAMCNAEGEEKCTKFAGYLQYLNESQEDK